MQTIVACVPNGSEGRDGGKVDQIVYARRTGAEVHLLDRARCCDPNRQRTTSAGTTVVGARKFLIAYNISLNTSDVGVAKSISRKIRASSGGYPFVKAMGVDLEARHVAQVSMNLTDFETTPIGTVFDAVERE